MKTCKKCNQSKSGTDYYARDNTCKECRKSMVRANRLANIEYYRDYDKKRAMQPDRVAARESYLKSEAGKAASNKAKSKWLINNQHKRTDVCRRYNEANPTKLRARQLVAYQIKIGNIKKLPCEVCGSTDPIHGHHDDYAKPLNVRWLCSKHHRQWHKENGEGLNPDADLSGYGSKKKAS